MKKHKPLHFNIPQIKVMLASAQKTYAVMSRGLGKTTGIIAPWAIENVRRMPRSMGGFVAASYQQMLVRTLPPVINGWERMGYKNGIHFVIGREPTQQWKKYWDWPGPRLMPLNSQHAIYWYNGSVQVMISQDRIGSSNGLSLSYLGGDEAKLLNKDRLDDEVMPTLRGDRQFYGHLSCYQSELFTTDMPTQAKAKWILEKEELMDQAKIDLIIETQLHLNELIRTHHKSTGDQKAVVLKKIRHYQRILEKLRKGTVYYAEANVYDNLDVLGEEYLVNMKEALSEIKYRASILNEKVNKVEGGFYPHLDEDTHGREWPNYSYLDGFADDPLNEKILTPDCRHDGGMDTDQPLDIALDYGASINCLVVGQEFGHEYRLHRSFYVLHPQLVDAVVHKFCDYYKHYPTKVVNYLYDHTAIGTSGVTDLTYKSQVMDTLRKRGWQVNEFECGVAPTHDRKYDFWGVLLQEKDDRLPRFRYSIHGAEQAILSMEGARVRKSRKGFEKDKTDERDPKAKQEETTHLSDAVDTLVFFRLKDRLDEDAGAPTSVSLG